jgi:uncharacterized protein (DUF302 family)
MRMIALFAALSANLFTAPLAQAGELVTPEDAPILVYRAGSNFDDTMTNLELAVTGQGLKISSVLHISEMLERTAGDLGLTEKLYVRAESVEFCSIVASYRMSQAHPGNLATCPLTIAVYTPAQEPEAVYLSFRRPQLLGDGAAAAGELLELLDGIAREAAE